MELSSTMIVAGLTTLFAVALLFSSLFVSGRAGLGKQRSDADEPGSKPE